MDLKRIGKFIAELRKEKGITQEQLAFELVTSRENVSKWERGVNTPTAESLLLLSKYFDISVNEILMGERKTEENKEQIENMSVEVMKAGEKKVRVVLKRFITLIAFMVVAFLVYYFIDTYNTIRVYKIAGEGDKFVISDGLAIFSKNKNYLRIGTISSEDDIQFDSFEIFYKDKNGNKESPIFVSNDTNYTLLTDYGYDEIFSYSNISKLENECYIRIKYQDKEEIIKLVFQRDMVNNFLDTNNEKDVVTEKYKIDDNNVIQKLENYADANWQYNAEENIYSYSFVSSNLKYEILYYKNSKYLVIKEYNNNTINIVEINLYNKNFTYTIENNDNMEEIFQYDLNKQKCVSGNCDSKIIDYYLKNYFKKYTS